ncbi:His Phos 2 domain containing protein [Asbolus verrucosus]|uniref:His Phos 2 domain containing protein n=1 Tax=Asbolus verrucosus TaxID=1661398 RepID=A0A482W4I1_ASBVE|nr:His Phos 2 domain containing protein [Asbolus verrucosus]
MEEIAINSMEEIAINSMEEIEINRMEEIEMNSMEEIATNRMEEIEINSMEEIVINLMEEIVVNDIAETGTKCTPVQFWSINRHGTRYPSSRTIERLRQLSKIHTEIIKNYDERQSFPDRGRLCMKDLDLFRKFEELMREPYSENAYSFQYTDSDRTHDSYQAYIEGLFKNNAYQVHANVFNDDRLIKFRVNITGRHK